MTKKEKSWILYDWANSAYSIVITTAILPVFFKQVAANNINSATSTAYWGYSNSIATLIISILAPLLGAIADYKGRKKKFFSSFLILGVMSTALLSVVQEGNWILCIFIYIFSVIGFTGSNIFYDAFLIDVTSEENMDMISSHGFAFGYIGSCIPFIISILFIKNPSLLGLTTSSATRLSFIITALWWLFFSIPMIKNVNQTYYIEPSKHIIKDSFSSLFNTFKNIIGYKNIFLFLISYFFYIDGVNTIIKMSTAYGLDLGIDGATLMIILLVLQFVAFPFTILYGKLSKKFSARTMIFVAIIIYTIISIYGYFITTKLDYWILALLVGSSQGGIQALSRSYFGKLIPKEKSTEFFGIYNIFGRFSSIFGPLLMGITSQVTGNSRSGVLSLIVLFILGFIFFMKVDKSSEKITYDLK
ncbi:MFS transporter [Clostridium hydrogeniformans]|uniref:MFS transporter n=1 Tax=Clostridium hydrogeniformans TaxID=349933 RepID=UPI00047F2E48|nr:MFS transporter [Clostridium hydrogeniformans]